MRAGPFDPYAVLGVARDASLLEIARARRRLAKRYHPDLSAGAPTTDASRMRDINEAWRILATPESRAGWDSTHPATPSDSHWTRPAPRARPSTGTFATPAAAASGGTSAGWRSSGGPAATVGPRPVGRPEEPSWYESGWFATAVVAMVALITFVGFVMLAPPPAEMPVRPGDAPLVQDNLDAP